MVSKSVKTQESPEGVAVDPETGQVYVADYGADDVTVVDGRRT